MTGQIPSSTKPKVELQRDKSRLITSKEIESFVSRLFTEKVLGLVTWLVNSTEVKNLDQLL